MKTKILLGLGTLGAALGLATSADARVIFGVSLGVPVAVPVVVALAPPVYYAPRPPVYYAPAPVYYAPSPAPVYYAPQPVYYTPAPVVVGPSLGIGFTFGGGWYHPHGYGHGWRR